MRTGLQSELRDAVTDADDHAHPDVHAHAGRDADGVLPVRGAGDDGVRAVPGHGDAGVPEPTAAADGGAVRVVHAAADALDRTPTPATATPVGTGTPVAAACGLGTGPAFVDWRQWYPLYVGQLPGQRAVNWFEHPGMCKGLSFAGVSLWDIPLVPGGGFPTQHAGECVDYYWLWNCAEPECRMARDSSSLVAELLSISSDGQFLDRWAIGLPKNWMEIYLDPSDLGECACEDNALREHLAANPDLLMTARVPYRWKMSRTPGEKTTSPVVCAVRFRDALNADGSMNIGVCNIMDAGAHLEFVRTSIVNYSDATGNGADARCDRFLALNEYFTTDCNYVDRMCEIAKEGYCNDPRCGRQGRALRVSPTEQPPLPAGGYGGCPVGNCEWCYHNVEAYAAERVTRPFGGNIAFLTMVSRGNCPYDTCVHYYVEDFIPAISEEEPRPEQRFVCAPAAEFWRTLCPDHPHCNDCPNCGMGGPVPSSTGTPEACCDEDPRPTPNASTTPCATCPQLAPVPTPAHGCCGVVVPTLDPTPPVGATWQAVCGTVTPTPPGATPTSDPAHTATPTWTPGPTAVSCCTSGRQVQFQFTDRPATAEDCDVLDGLIDNTGATFPVTAFCGAGDDRYAAIIEVDLCCAQGDCSGELIGCPASPIPIPPLGILRAFGGDQTEVMSPVSICYAADRRHWVIRLDCIFDSDDLPTRWQLEVNETTVRPWRMTVTYVCCFAGNCAPTPTATP